MAGKICSAKGVDPTPTVMSSGTVCAIWLFFVTFGDCIFSCLMHVVGFRSDVDSFTHTLVPSVSMVVLIPNGSVKLGV